MTAAPPPGLPGTIAHRLAGDEADLPVEGHLASFAGATGWLNSAPLTADGLRGRVVLIDFWTFTCVNWLRTLPYVRAWAAKYADQGLTVIGVHTPEFDFEHDVANITAQARAMRVDYPIAIDSDYAVWQAFGNHYWPAIYLADAEGRIRYHHFGEGEYAMTEMAIQQLLTASGADVGMDLVEAEPVGLEVPADYRTLRSPETYLGHRQATSMASPGSARYDRPTGYAEPGALPLNAWAPVGAWTVTGRALEHPDPGSRIAIRFQGRDVNLVMGPPRGSRPVRFRVLLDGRPVGAAHGTDVANDGTGTAAEQRTYQLVRQPGPIEERTFEIAFLDPGIEAFCFTFG